ncbi:MAG: class I SAM-dependent methyltransferase [Ekhidna sp.]|nr:class I SAM-dependent methyltransferase [Ekhidna sp.]
MPYWLSKLIKSIVKPALNSWQKHIDANISHHKLEEIHVQHAKVLANRQKLLELLPKNGVVAELGVDKGYFSQLIFEKCNPRKLHLVDSWDSKRYNDQKKIDVITHFKKYNDIVNIHVGLSTEVVREFQDEYFDWIYIDTDHSFKTTKQELELYKDKIKAGGIIAGHDFSTGNWLKLNRYGVIEAVYEFCTKYKWEIIYLTAELSNDGEMPSFAIKRI